MIREAFQLEKDARRHKDPTRALDFRLTCRPAAASGARSRNGHGATPQGITFRPTGSSGGRWWANAVDGRQTALRGE